MKRPHLVHFLSIMTEDTLSIKASITMKEASIQPLAQIEKLRPSFPIQALRLLNAYNFSMKVIGLTSDNKNVYEKVFESDSYGNFQFKIPLSTTDRKKISALQVYEVSRTDGLEYLLGSYIPLKLEKEKKMIICDFDKTLVDTRYSTTKELYRSLTNPIEYFPIIPKSVDLLNEAIEKGFHPFILSASPHFYEDAMRDWLYQHQIFTAGIFLKDYRKVFSFFEDDLTPKDLKIHGMYKLNHLLDILHMTGIPDELILMGDNFEADPVIYLALAKLLKGRVEPRRIWSELKNVEAFQLTKKQDSKFLNKIYQLHSLVQREGKFNTNIKIYIRRKAKEKEFPCPAEFIDQKHHIELYDGPALKKNTGSEENNIANTEN